MIKFRNVFLAVIAIALACPAASSKLPKFNYRKLQRQAAKEYLKPISPGYEGKNPFWNGYSVKFIYAPAFDFKEVDGARKYLYTLRKEEQEWTFKDDKPYHSLAPIWNKIPAGDVVLKVEAIDKKGKVICVVGERKFIRDFPFTGKYPGPVRSYKEAAIKALLFIHNLPAIQNWKTQNVPDMSYKLNTYPAKSIGGTIRCEMLLAKLVPSLREDAIAIARSAADFLIRESQPADAPLAYFPPTYYGGLHASAYNEGKMMSMEATKASNALLDLYDETGDRKYYDQVIGILDTYRKLQRKDGSFPIKLVVATGEPDNDVCARLHPILGLARRIHDQYGVNDYEAMRLAGEKWMNTEAFKDFDMVAQFEDISAKNEPYKDQTHWTCVPYATYMLNSGLISKENLKVARLLIAFGEDQFTNWESFPNDDGLKTYYTPGVVEQFYYRTPIDDSAASMASAWMALYEETGDRLSLAKAKALMDEVTKVQIPESGLIPTAWEWYPSWRFHADQIWISCCYITCNTLLRFAEMAEPGSIPFEPTFWF